MPRKLRFYVWNTSSSLNSGWCSAALCVISMRSQGLQGRISSSEKNINLKPLATTIKKKYHKTIFPSIIRQQRTVLCHSIETVIMYIVTIELCEINSKGFFKCDVSLNTNLTRYLGSFFLQGTIANQVILKVVILHITSNIVMDTAEIFPLSSLLKSFSKTPTGWSS